MFPCRKTVRWIPSVKVKHLGRLGSFSLIACTRKVMQQARYQGRIAKSEQTWDGHSEVLADHSTGAQSSVAER
jgi:hypothetical protein